MKKKLILLDRDGVINYDSPEFIKSPHEWKAIPGSLKAIAMLNQANIRIAIATNQSGLARGYFTEETLNQIHQKMHEELKAEGGMIDKIFYCPHGPHDHCDCRKPKPGMLLKAFDYFNVKAEQACFIGDSARDIEAAMAANCDGILVSDQFTLLDYVYEFLGKPL